MKKFFLRGFLLLAIPLCADFRVDFKEDAKPFDTLPLLSRDVPELGNLIRQKPGHILTRTRHAILPGKEVFSKGRCFLVYKECNRSSIELLARADKNFLNYYSLQIWFDADKIVLSRYRFKGKCSRKEYPYKGGRDISLALDFNGKTIVARVNGKYIDEIPDDGKPSSGLSGIRCGFWTDIMPVSFGFTEKIPASDPNEKKIPHDRKEAKNVSRLDISKNRNWDLGKAHCSVNGERIRTSLNQIWEFHAVPSMEKSVGREDGPWGYFVVPGYYAQGATVNFVRDAEGKAYTRWNGMELSKSGIAGIYRRKFMPPARWKDRNLLLVLENISGAAVLSINGKKAAEKKDSGLGTLRINPAVFLKFGSENSIELKVGSARNKTSGVGNIYMEETPRENFGEAFLSTSVTNREMRIRFSGAQVPAGSKISISIQSRGGRKLYEKAFPFTREIVLPWIAPKLWTPDTPELYFLRLALEKNGKILDSKTIRFGFREFTRKNGMFYLNGNPISIKAETAIQPTAGYWDLNYHLNPNYLRTRFAGFRTLGLNAAYSETMPSEDSLDAADETGIMLLVRGRMFSHTEYDNIEKVLSVLKDSLETMRADPRFSNHPCQIGFLIDVWYAYDAGCTNPNYLGLPSGDPNEFAIIKDRRRKLNAMAKLYRAYFPDKFCFTGGSGAVDGVYGTHIYHTWGAPSAELRSIFSRWAKERDIPVFVGETYLPYIGSFFQIDNFRGGGINYSAENTARLYGGKAYSMGRSTVRRPFHEWGRDGWFWQAYERKEDSSGIGFTPEGPLRVTVKYVEEIMPVWRFDGLSGAGLFDYTSGTVASQNAPYRPMKKNADYSDFTFKPEAFSNGNIRRPFFDPATPDGDLRPSLLFAPFRRATASRTAFILGSKESPRLQDHSGYAGEILKKSILLLNEKQEKMEGILSFRLKGANRRIELGEKKISIPPFGRLLIPAEVLLPSVRDREEWIFEAVFQGRNEKIGMTLPVQVFARRNVFQGKSKIYLYDPEGVLASRMKARGISFEKYTSLSRLPENGILIVGRGALSSAKTMPDWKLASEKGLRILIMEQHLAASPELLKSRTRRVFINAKGHPVFSGLSDADFAYWKGNSSIAPKYVKDPAGANWSDWGAENMVAAYVFRRPQYGNTLALLASGFDLFQSPLLEYSSGKSCVILSQLEITERLGIDPAATRVFENMLSYLDAPRAEKRTIFFGGNGAESWIGKMGIRAEKVSDLSEKTLRNADNLLLIDPSSADLKKYRAELAEFVWAGGKAITVVRGDVFHPLAYPFPISLGKAVARFGLAPESDNLCGWGNSELYWNEMKTVPVFTNFPEGSEKTHPACVVRVPSGCGDFVFTTLLPERFSGMAQGKIVRQLSAMLTAAGVKMEGSFVPYAIGRNENELDLSERKWEFSTDEKNTGIKENRHMGENGSGKWLKGLIADGVEVRVGQPFERFLFFDYNGVAWYRLTFDVPEHMLKKNLLFSAGAIDDLDEVWINGKRIGGTDKNTPHYWEVIRNYPVPSGLLRKNGNILAIRVTDLQGGGGITIGPVRISDRKLDSFQRAWTTPYPEGAKRDYEYHPDIVRMY